MSGEALAWTAVVGGAFGVAVCMFLALRKRPLARWLVSALTFAVLAVPVTVRYEGAEFAAPAAPVAVFKGFLEAEGDPGPALMRLGIACALAAGLVLLAWFAARSLNGHRGPDEHEGAADDAA